MAGKNKFFKIFVNIIMTVLSCACILPFILLIMASITDETTLTLNGYSFFPARFSFTAYQYLFSAAGKILKAYGMTFLVMRVLSFMTIFTMLFNGGMVASYIIWGNVMKIGDTIFALIFPNLMLGAYSVILARTYFTSNIPDGIIEAARIDSCSELGIMFRIVAPLSKPMVATLGLLAGLGYWNDWINGLYYLVRRTDLYTIQNVLNTMMANADFLTNNSNVAALRESNLSVPTSGVRMGIAVIAVIPILIIYPFFQKYFVKGIVIGGIKG